MSYFLETIANFQTGFHEIASFGTIWVMALGTLVGILVGAMPGLSPAVGCAMVLPLTFSMSPTFALLLLVSIYSAAEYSGSIAAILINTPGTAGAVATTLDGYQLTRKGKPGLALGISLWASVIGGVIGTLGLMFFAAPMAKLALRFESYEYFSLAVLGLTIISSLAGEDYIKGFISALLGLLLMTVGVDHELSFVRFGFGLQELQDGISFVPAMIGLFALTEVFSNLAGSQNKKTEPVNLLAIAKFPKFRDIWPLRWVITKSSIIGTLIGVVPGHGAALSAIIAYNEARRSSRNPEEFGKGSLEGVAAPEAANNSCVPAALIPLLSLGIPGTPTTAIMMGALMMHKINPGPELFKPAPAGHPEIVYGLFVSLLLSFVMLTAIGLLGNNLWVKIVKIPEPIIYAMIICFSFIGSYFLSSSLFDVGVCLVFGLIGWFLKRNKFPTAPVILGLILGKLIEENLRLSLVKGSALLFFTRPLSGALLIGSVIFFVWPFLSKLKASRA